MKFWKKSVLTSFLTILFLIPSLVITSQTQETPVVLEAEENQNELLATNYDIYTNQLEDDLKNIKINFPVKVQSLPTPPKIVENPQPTPEKQVQTGDWEAIIRETCAEYNCTDYETNKIFIPMMYAESGGRNTAYNKSSGASGLFQHLPQYWDARVKRILGADVTPNIWDPHQQIKISIHMFKVESQGSAWVASKCGYMELNYGKDYADKRREAGNCWDPDNTLRFG